MEKCIVAKLSDYCNESFGGSGRADWIDENGRFRCKLVDVRFPRRPPTFGVVYLSTQRQSNQPDAAMGLSLNLSILKLIGTNKNEAKFINISKVNLGPAIIASDFDVANELQMDDDYGKQTSNSGRLHCILASHNGLLFDVDLTANTIDGAINKTTTTGNSSKPAGEPANGNNIKGNSAKQLVVELRHQSSGLKNYLPAQPIIQCNLQTSFSFESSSELTTTDDSTQTKSFIHVLSGTMYLSYTLLPNNCIRLIEKDVYDLSAKFLTNVRFIRMLIIESQQQTAATGSIIDAFGTGSLALIELSNSCLHVVEKGNCLHVLQLDAPLLHRCTALRADANDPSTSTGLDITLISLYETNLVGYSLQTSFKSSTTSVAHKPRARIDNNLMGFDEKDEEDVDQDDHLLEPEPSFELEKCWSIDLNDIDSIRALGFESGQNSAKEDASSISSSGCLCPIWSTTQLLANKSTGAGENQLGWPKFLLIAHRFHLLLYTFEQSPQMPFSLVYDRAFMNEISLDTHTGAQKQPTNTGAAGSSILGLRATGSQMDECIDVKLRPKLLHNYKLVGANYPLDSLYNTMFLANRIHLTQARQFPLLGILIAISNYGHIFAFKLRSGKVDASNKDNVYQQLVIDSLNESSALLMDEIQRTESSNHLLRNDIDSLEKSLNSLAGRSQVHATSATLADNFDRMLGAKLVPRRTMAGLYDLRISLSSLIQVKRMIVTSTVSCMMLDPMSSLSTGSSENSTNFSSHLNKCTIESYRLNNDVSEMNSNAFVVADSTVEQSSDEPDLNRVKSYICIDLETFGPQRGLVTVPMFLMDSQQFGGSIQVNFVIEGQSNVLSCLQEQRNYLIDSIDQHYRKQQVALKYYTKTIILHPLESYSLVQKGELQVGVSIMIRLEVKAKIEDDKWIQWLGECVSLGNYDGNQATVDNMRQGRLESFFTHCIIDFEVSELSIRLMSDDFIAIELCKKHFLSKATDECIELEIIEHTTPTSDHLRHILANQYSNIDEAKQILSHIDPPKQKESNVNLIVESLIGEDNLNQLAPYLFTEEMKSRLQESLREDAQETDRPSMDSNQQVRADTGDARYLLAVTLIDIAIGFLIDNLVDFDRLNGKRVATSTLINMRAKLDQRYKSTGSLGSMSKFVDAILTDWHDLTR